MVSTSGGKLLNDNAIDALINYLFSLATVITPNIPEAETLVGFSINDRSDMQKAAEKISKLTTGSVLIKGGHLEDSADDLLFTDGKVFWLKSPKIYNPNTHGTGCTLSSAIACNLALGLTTLESVKNAKEYITGAIKAGLNIGRGRGPLNHCYNL